MRSTARFTTAKKNAPNRLMPTIHGDIQRQEADGFNRVQPGSFYFATCHFATRRSVSVAAEADARVEPEIDEIDRQVRDHHEESGEQGGAHDQRDIEVENGLLSQPT